MHKIFMLSLLKIPFLLLFLFTHLLWSEPCSDICDLNLIYNEEYEYFFSKETLESYLSGKAFDHTDFYTQDESKRLQCDIQEIFQSILSKNPEKEKIAILTAGAPGSGKTTKQKQDLEENLLKGHSYAYICPDDVCLKNQTRTYLAEINCANHAIASRQNAYNKWRPGSNAATHLITAHLIREGYGFYYGTTSTGPSAWKFYEFLKLQGYKIRVIYTSAPDDVRWASIKERDKTFVQTTEKDVFEKGFLLPQRILDTFLKYADEIDFCFRSSLNEDAILAAEWRRKEEGSLGTLQIVDSCRYEKIKAIHNEAAKVLQRPDLYWELTIEALAKLG